MLTFACWWCWLGGSYLACVMEQHIPILGICFKQIQAARVMEQYFPEFREALKKVPLTCVRDGVTFRSQKA